MGRGCEDGVPRGRRSHAIGKASEKWRRRNPYKDALEAAQRVYSGWKAEANQYAFLLSLLGIHENAPGVLLSEAQLLQRARKVLNLKRRLTENPSRFQSNLLVSKQVLPESGVYPSAEHLFGKPAIEACKSAGLQAGTFGERLTESS